MTFRSENHKLINSVWRKEELPEQWKESIVVPIYKGDKTDCSNYRDISLLSTSYKTLSNILLSRLSVYVDEVIWDHECGFRRNRSTTDYSFCILQILENKMGVQWDSTSAVHRLQESVLWRACCRQCGVCLQPLLGNHATVDVPCYEDDATVAGQRMRAAQ
jgi:hypothetical protein